MTAADIINSDLFYGPNRPRIRGTTARYTDALRVKAKEQRVDIPNDCHRMDKITTTTTAVMVVGGIPLLVMYSWGITFCTAEFVVKTKNAS